jgi:hypothetical protein
MSTYLKSQGCALVGFERSMWTVVKEGRAILITAHIHDFIIACADRRVLDEFRTALLQRFEGTYDCEVHTYLGCKILNELEAGKTLCLRNIMLKTSCAHMTIGNVFLPYSYDTRRLTQEQCDPHPEPAFHRRYSGIVGSLGFFPTLGRIGMGLKIFGLTRALCPPTPSPRTLHSTTRSLPLSHSARGRHKRFTTFRLFSLRHKNPDMPSLKKKEVPDPSPGLGGPMAEEARCRMGH